MGMAAAFGLVTSKLAHNYLLSHIAQDEKWKTLELPGLNATVSVGGSYAVCLADGPIGSQG